MLALRPNPQTNTCKRVQFLLIFNIGDFKDIFSISYMAILRGQWSIPVLRWSVRLLTTWSQRDCTGVVAAVIANARTILEKPASNHSSKESVGRLIDRNPTSFRDESGRSNKDSLFVNSQRSRGIGKTAMTDDTGNGEDRLQNLK